MTKLSICTTNIVNNMALHQLLGASRNTPPRYLMHGNVNLNTGMSNFFFCIDIKVNAYFFISDSGGAYGENLVSHLLFSKFGG